MSRFRPGSTSLCGDTGEPTRFAFHPRDSRDRSGARRGMRLCLGSPGGNHRFGRGVGPRSISSSISPEHGYQPCQSNQDEWA